MDKDFPHSFSKQLSFSSHFYLFIILFISTSIISSVNLDCPKGIVINDQSCFNDLITIKKNFRAGNFAINKNGDMIIEYSNDKDSKRNIRLFYGIKKNGRYFFPEEEAYREKEINNPYSNRNIVARYEARNIFVSVESDTNKEKEYLFSTSSYETLTELHDLENNDVYNNYFKTYYINKF